MTEYKVHRLLKNISVIKNEVELIDRKLGRLLKHKEALKIAVSARRKELAQIRSLPPEILSEIFIWLMQLDPINFIVDGGFKPFNYFKDHRTAQVQLLLVCKKWHDIVLALPPLWSKLRLEIEKTYRAEEIAKFGRWLARSHPGTLDLSLFISHDYYRSSSESVKAPNIFLDTVAPHLQRCTRIHSSLHHQHISRLLLCQGNMFPRLRHLDLGFMPHGPPRPLHIDFTSYPQLETLSITDESSYYSALDLRFRGECPSLRDIELHSLTGDQIMDILKCCNFVTTCEVYSVGNATFTRDKAALQLSHLMKLTMRQDAHLAKELLDRLLLPSLQSLTLDMEVNSLAGLMPEDPLHLTQFLRRSCPPLTELELKGFAFWEANIISFLSVVPNLRSLTLVRISPDDELFHALTMMKGSVDDSRSNLCPELTELRISDCLAKNVSVSAVAKMVLSRSNVREDVPRSCKPLKHLYIRSCIKESHQALLLYPGFHECIENGLDIKG